MKFKFILFPLLLIVTSTCFANFQFSVMNTSQDVVSVIPAPTIDSSLWGPLGKNATTRIFPGQSILFEVTHRGGVTRMSFSLISDHYKVCVVKVNEYTLQPQAPCDILAYFFNPNNIIQFRG